MNKSSLTAVSATIFSFVAFEEAQAGEKNSGTDEQETVLENRDKDIATDQLQSDLETALQKNNSALSN